jgi:VWFA-related protein
MRNTTFLPALLFAPLAVVTMTAGHPDRAAAAETNRTVYVTVTDNKGVPVTDLTAADFTVREGGRERQIVTAEPATTRMRLALLIEQRLVGDGSIRMGLFDFIKRMHGEADIAVITVGLRNQTVVDYTGDLNTHVAALNKLTLNPNPASNLTEGVMELAKTLEGQKPERPVIVAVALSGGQAGGPSANAVLTQLRQSGANMHAVTLTGGGEVAQNPAEMADAAGREQVLGDGARQSGGRRHEATTTAAVAKALQAVANDLLAQYALTYTLPDGVKPDRRFNVNVKRRGVTLRAPNALPDR